MFSVGLVLCIVDCFSRNPVGRERPRLIYDSRPHISKRGRRWVTFSAICHSENQQAVLSELTSPPPRPLPPPPPLWLAPFGRGGANRGWRQTAPGPAAARSSGAAQLLTLARCRRPGRAGRSALRSGHGRPVPRGRRAGVRGFRPV